MGEVVVHLAGVGAPDVADVRGLIEAVGGEVDAIEVGGFGELFHCSFWPEFLSIGCEARVQLFAGVVNGVAVKVTRCRGGGRGAVRNGVCGRFGDENVREGNVKGLGCDDGHFGVQALAHFAAAVGDKDGAVVVNVDEGASLVEEDGGEGDAKFGGDDGEATFVPFVFGVEVFDGFSPLSVIGF